MNTTTVGGTGVAALAMSGPLESLWLVVSAVALTMAGVVLLRFRPKREF